MNTLRSDGSKTLGASLPPLTSHCRWTHKDTIPCNHGNIPGQLPPNDQPLLPLHPWSRRPPRPPPRLQHQRRAWKLTPLYRRLSKQPSRPIPHPSKKIRPFPILCRTLLIPREYNRPLPQTTSSSSPGTETSTPSLSSNNLSAPDMRAPHLRGSLTSKR